MPCVFPPIGANLAGLREFVPRFNWAVEGSVGECTSWWRSTADNARVGGHPFSQHLIGWAADVTGPHQDAIAKRARLAGMVAVKESDHTHIQLLPAGILQTMLSGPRRAI